MKFTLYPPSAQLAPYVAGYGVFEKSAQEPSLCVLPNGHPSLLFQTGNGQLRYSEPTGSACYLPACTVLGQYRHPYFLDGCSGEGSYFVYLKPHTAIHFLQHPLYLFTNQWVDTEEIFGSRWQNAAWQVRKAQGHEEAIQRIEALLLRALERTICEHTVVSRAIQCIVASHGSISSEELAEQMGVGRRYLEQRFRVGIGISPKAYAKIIQFNYMLHLLEVTTQPQWVDLTYMGGYFDQSHFIRTFREFTSVSPSAYCKGRVITAPSFYTLYHVDESAYSEAYAWVSAS